MLQEGLPGRTPLHADGGGGQGNVARYQPQAIQVADGTDHIADGFDARSVVAQHFDDGGFRRVDAQADGQGGLGVYVHHDHRSASGGQFGAQVEDGRGFGHPALLIGYGNDRFSHVRFPFPNFPVSIVRFSLSSPPDRRLRNPLSGLYREERRIRWPLHRGLKRWGRSPQTSTQRPRIVRLSASEAAAVAGVRSNGDSPDTARPGWP